MSEGRDCAMNKNREVPIKPRSVDAPDKAEQIQRAQQMVLESYADELAGAEPLSSEEVRSLMERIIKEN